MKNDDRMGICDVTMFGFAGRISHGGNIILKKTLTVLIPFPKQDNGLQARAESTYFDKF